MEALASVTEEGAAMSGGRHDITGVFDGANHADRAVTALKDAGFSPEQVDVSVPSQDGSTSAASAAGGAAAGGLAGALPAAAIGGVIGLVLGLLIGLDIVPSFAGLADAGPIATAIGGLVLGAIVGGLIGLLLGASKGAADATAPQSGKPLRKGSVLLTVHATSQQQAQEARQLFESHGAADIRT